MNHPIHPSYQSNQKYRPYFTLGELKELVSALKQSPSTQRLSLIQYLDGFILQIERGIRKPNHTIQPSLLQRLELDDSTPIPISHEVTGKMAYEKWIINPSSCSPKEIKECLQWRYENDLMSREEEDAYEISQLGA